MNTQTHPTDLAGYFLFFFFLLPAGACPIGRLGHRRVCSKWTEQLFLKSIDNVLKCHSLIFWCLQKDKSNILKKDKSNIYYGIVWAIGLTCLLLGKIRQRVAIYRKSRCITPHRPSFSTEHPLALFSTLYSHKYFHGGLIFFGSHTLYCSPLQERWHWVGHSTTVC